MKAGQSDNQAIGQSEQARIIAMARHALPLMAPEAQREVDAICNELERTANAAPGEPETLEEFTRRAGAAFEHDMKPVTGAIVAALKADDLAALQGLRALLPHLLSEVNRDPVLSDLLAYQLGRDVLAGFAEEQRAMNL